MIGRSRTRTTRYRAAIRGALLGAAVLTATGGIAPAVAAPAPAGRAASTATPVKHLVVIYDENVSFDHYFATYPKAAGTDGTTFTAAKDTPKADNLLDSGLLRTNPNEYPPTRLGASQPLTCDQNHSYGPEQYAYDGGRVDGFVQNTETGKCSGGLYGEPGLSMDYYDGNTVTALWNYAQHYALGDHSFSSTYGPSTPGALELVSGQTHGVVSVDPAGGTRDPKPTKTPDPYTVASADAKGVGTVINDPDPAFDDCADSDHTSTDALAEMSGRNVGDLLNEHDVSWGWFQGGFAPSSAWNGEGTDYAKCAGATHDNVGGASSEDYSPHHDPFQYYRSTANPHHLPPRSLDEIGHDGQADHQYDLSAFDQVVKAGRLPAVSFLKAAEYQDGHAGYSDPVDEQHFLVKEINQLQRSPQWQDTAVVVAYDDSDGWYDHVYSKPLNGSKDSTTAADGKATDGPACQSGPAPAGGYQDRCGPGTRQPLMVISPFSKADAVVHTPTEQASIPRFIEDNWHTGRIGGASFDQRAGSLDSMFDFRHPNDTRTLLNTDGTVASVRPIHRVADPDAREPTTAVRPAAGDRLAATGASFPGVAAGCGAVVVLGTAAAVGAALRRRDAA